MKNELDRNFVVMAQCYARDAANGGLEDCLTRLKAYQTEAGVDWVQFESPHDVEEIKRARAVVPGAFSFMKGKMPRYLGLDKHLALSRGTCSVEDLRKDIQSEERSSLYPSDMDVTATSRSHCGCVSAVSNSTAFGEERIIDSKNASFLTFPLK